MKDSLPLPESKKITVTYRLEPGCLGPKGSALIDSFCEFAQKQVQDLDSDYVIWSIVPRHDKTQPELQYSVLGKKINHAQADKYLAVFDKCINEFQEHIENKLTSLVDDFFER